MAWSMGVWEVLSGLGDGRYARVFWCFDVWFWEDSDNGIGLRKYKGSGRMLDPRCCRDRDLM
jgi:hypothetical protein